MILHDLYCPQCQMESKRVPVDVDNLPCCPDCATQMRTDWSHGQAPSTDVRGTPITSNVLEDRDGNPITYTSTRDLESQMRREHPGSECVGDKSGGARNEHRLTGRITTGGGLGASASRSTSA